QGELSKLLGQFASLLVFFSLIFSLATMGFDDHMPLHALLIFTWSNEHSLIATTMLVVGLFAVLSWDSTFPNRLDVLVLAPLPVRTRTLFQAKVAASASALSVTVAALNLLSGLAWPIVLAPPSSGFLSMIFSAATYRPLAAYWITMLASGAFIFCSVLCIQGLAAQLLPRRPFLRLSAFLQLAAFCLFLSVYFLQPSLATPEALAAPENQRMLAWLPSYWFLGLFQELNGSLNGPGQPALALLAARAWTGLAVTLLGAGAAFLLSYFRTLRKIVEEPDILPGACGINWIPSFGNSLKTTVVQFTVRTLLRSRRHRIILAFYWGLGFAIVISLLKTTEQQQLIAKSGGMLSHQANGPLLFSTIVMLCLAVLGTRVVFAMPLDLRANWIFRVTPVRGGPECLAATRLSLFVLAVAPVWGASAALLLSIWPWRPAVEHLIVLGLVGIVLVELCLLGLHKIPFTCSYLPGKSYFHMAAFAFLCLSLLMNECTELERRALDNPGRYAIMLAVLVIAALCARWRTAVLANSPEAALHFVEEPTPAILPLGLNRDGVVPV
ncbi:MAG: hypothetical protein WAM39_09780, partial [Bryobacteraceae bacterium]